MKGGKCKVDIFLEELHNRADERAFRVRTIPGIHRIYQSHADAGGLPSSVTMLSPLTSEYGLYGRGLGGNCFSPVFRIEVAGKQLLIGTNALIPRWKNVIKQAQEAQLELSADVFIVPQFGSHMSLDKTVIRAVVNRNGFSAILPTSEIFKRPKFKIPDDDVLAELRAAGGELIVAGNEPMHFILNADGLYRAVSNP